MKSKLPGDTKMTKLRLNKVEKHLRKAAHEECARRRAAGENVKVVRRARSYTEPFVGIRVGYEFSVVKA